MISAARPLAVKVSSSDSSFAGGASGQITVSTRSCPFLKEGELHRLPLRLADEAEPWVADARRSAPHRPSRGCVAGWRRHHRARPQRAAARSTITAPAKCGCSWTRRLAGAAESNPTRLAPGERRRSDREHRAASDAPSARTERSRIGEVGDHPSESFERCQPADIADLDVLDERVRIAMQIE